MSSPLASVRQGKAGVGKQSDSLQEGAAGLPVGLMYQQLQVPQPFLVREERHSRVLSFSLVSF